MENKQKLFSKKRIQVITGLLFLSLLAGCTTPSQSDTSSSETIDSSQQQTTGNVDEQGNVTISNVQVNVSSEITDAVKVVEDTVVSVINLQKASNQTDEWGLFGGSGEETSVTQDQERLEQIGTGSGVIYKKDGDRAFLVTNNHVVEGSDAIEIILRDGTKADAEVIGTDVWTDLAVLSISSKDITTVAEFGDSDSLTVGEPAIAIGSPLGTNFASSVTAGIISAIGRTVPVDTTGDKLADWEMTAIQTDAAINPGNSGGALVNVSGQVVGINSMKISLDTVEGIGFAIPSNDVVFIVNKLEKDGEVVRPMLGISLVDLAMISRQQQETVLQLPLDIQNGVVIAQVTEDSPAALAGLKQYDVIVNFNGIEVNNTIELRKEIYKTDIGDEIEIEFYRKDEKQKVTVEMKEGQEGF